jgi:multisubunit Na+/H+ antiporter MnhE subunit
MITLQSIITLAYYALTAAAAALLLYNFVRAKSWEREVLYLIVLAPFLLRVLRLK